MTTRFARYAPFIAVTAAFVASRVVYRYHFGLRYDYSPLDYFIQYIDTTLLRDHFWSSILHIHQQAPVMNLVVGGLWKVLGPQRAFGTLDVAFVCIGYGFAVALLALLRRLGVGAILATLVTIAFTASPFFALYEAWMFYPLPVACLLVVAGLAMLRAYRRLTFGRASLFFWILCFTASIRNIYGTVWMAGVLLVIMLRPPVAPTIARPRALLLKAAAGPLFVAWLIGAMPSFTVGPAASSAAAAWANIGYRIYHGIPTEERARLREAGKLSNAFELEPFSPVNQLSDVRVPHEPTGVPLLDVIRPGGRPNAFTYEYLLICDKYLKPEGQFLLKTYPDVYLRSVWKGFTDWYPSPPTRDLVFSRTSNRRRLGVLERAIGKVAGVNSRGRYMLLLIALPITLLYGIWLVLRPRSVQISQRPTVALAAVMVATIVYTSFGTVMISYGDYSRYRFDVDAFYTVLATLALQRVISAIGRGVRRLRARSTTSPPALAAEPAEPATAPRVSSTEVAP